VKPRLLMHEHQTPIAFSTKSVIVSKKEFIKL
jgi:hypothetical protein